MHPRPRALTVKGPNFRVFIGGTPSALRASMPHRSIRARARRFEATPKARFVGAKRPRMGAIAKLAVGLGVVLAARPVAALEDVLVARPRRCVAPAHPFRDVADEVEHAFLGGAHRMRPAWIALVETRGFL